MRLSIPAALAAVIVVASSLPSDAAAEDRRIAEIPPIGYGTWFLDRSNASDAVAAAFRTGYRHIDCAPAYGNEKEVGEGIRRGADAAGAKRGEFWVTSKLWNADHAPDKVEAALDRTLADLGLEYLDLYLMHWPVAKDEGTGAVGIDYVDTWNAMKSLLATGKTRFVGVSNFSPAQVARILPVHVPYAHQLEMHPYLPQSAFLSSQRQAGIRVTAYSPLGNTNPTYGTPRKEGAGSKVPPLLEHAVVKGIAAQRRCTPAQVVLKWGMLRDTSVIPKSAREDRMAENWESLGCELTDEDRAKLEDGLQVKRFNDLSGVWGVKLFEGLQDAGGAGEGLTGGVWRTVEGAVGKARGVVEGVWRKYRSHAEEL